MPDLQMVGRMLLVLGGFLALVGLALMAGGRFLPWLGRLPGDIHIQRGNVSCFFPLATSILLSILLTVVLNLLIRLFNR
ncbi:MAG: DUF2905 domain-containing protein [Caldilineae bacterium]|nr:MAG: DUF2905 domain-containing protein [Caldilineae bacterium]